MTLQMHSARTPGPLGIVPGALGGRLPGPLQFTHVDLSKGGATKAAAKTLEMPAPALGSSSVIRARTVNWKLSAGSPLTEDVQQGELANCPVAAILAAMAHTTNGKRRIDSMITEYTGTTVKTTFSADTLKTLAAKTDGDPDYQSPDTEILSSRYFSVNLGSAFEVSDVLYFDTDRSGVDIIYMRSPKQALWPCLIEKAYAQKVGSYQDLDDDSKHHVAEFWKVLVGKTPQQLDIDDETSLDKIAAAAKAASTIPTIGASRENATRVEGHHGFAIMGMSGTQINLYNPHGKMERISLNDFRKDFLAIFSGSP